MGSSPVKSTDVSPPIIILHSSPIQVRMAWLLQHWEVIPQGWEQKTWWESEFLFHMSRFTIYSLELETDEDNWSLNCVQCLIIAVHVSFVLLLNLSFLILLQWTLLLLHLARHHEIKKKNLNFFYSAFSTCLWDICISVLCVCLFLLFKLQLCDIYFLVSEICAVLGFYAV